MLEYPVFIHFHDEQEVVRRADRDAIGVGEIVENDLGASCFRVEDHDSSVPAVLHDVEHRGVHCVPIFSGAELAAGLAEKNTSVASDRKIVGKDISVVTAIQGRDRPIGFDALQTRVGIGDDQ